MRYISIERVEPGHYLGKTIYSANGTVMLSAGVQLTVFMINTLNRIGVTMLYIQDTAYADIDISDMVSEETKQAVIREMNETVEAIRSGKEWKAGRIGVQINAILEAVLSSEGVLLQLNDIRTAENQWYVHAMNVCMISTLIGANMGLNSLQLKELAAGALLHDIGKVGAVPWVESTGTLQEHHTWRGFERLKSKQEFSLLTAHIALQHHEQPDGRGLPRGLAADEINSYAKIVAAANRYDNLVNPAIGGLQPQDAVEKLMSMSEKELDHKVLIQFTRIISVYPNGMSVRLSTKETGVVVRQHRGLPSRPVVRIVRGSGEDFEVAEIDLALHTTVFIEAVLT
ncbi:HD-GYP domain-containing protein [Paenibacillus tarimensis]|uniref:HD-GYP domain-containing protein n=1 Tax=Paenibacillus tarimensis TaxID=416012 RepID=UPI001F38FC58|nr:HD domain-containing phosphohydrolase [Paenibacillus tarimensis]MCF2944670.1 HD domain-containing protein [Paenibacillus tarimensis]